MRFSTRNAFYLRASNYRVIPLFLYLDERHVDWMSTETLDGVIGKLHPKIKELLTVSRYEKKHKVYVERGEGYQYCYFLRNTTRTEVVLLKKKTFSLRPPSPAPPQLAPEPSRKRKRSRRARTDSMVADVEAARDDAELQEEVMEVKAEPLDDEEYVPRPSTLDDEDNETQIKDWKPDVTLAYQGFGTSSVQLVLIVEPYPPLPPEEYAPPASRLSTRSVSVMTSRSRSRTGMKGTRYSSTSLALDVAPRAPAPQVRNMRNATRSASVAETGGSWRGSRNLRDASATPFASGQGRTRTPLFMPRDTPFDNDEEDEEEHEAFAEALRDGRFRLPSVAPREQDDEDDNPFDEPEGMMALGERLVHASQIEEGVYRNAAGWEEMGEGEESDVLGRQEPGE
ncbi:hypothetical protein CC85DRAFT_289063 [Cutaneotrichosporon oleaginosum]|uniref:Uncharacterized protein n=1 Tax=Cutaneotrichosporon oleaginosum TaxID=879819 RepID=A0A0J0XCZ0_9TREE|nr:uncharacterized protein CC85DRAFT_289063 [Cutaneotrichosporon oleaginosum]KLT38931.1 hypothetical protein CC85DRAFT_289063 [Cutaneotrichosporon oleaginosum]TXT14705.1 hypothetical protein COLE_00898 [Cutaneotrichosporon oleaginosum]